MLITIALIAAVLVLIVYSKRTIKGTVTMNAQQAQSLLTDPDLLILDVRTPQEFGEGHIKNARLIPVAELGGRIAEIAAWKEKPVLVYCRSGGRSASAAQMLVGAGFKKINNLAGGIGAWSVAGFTVE
jgi:rhodanese-related sulfurtransferase